MKAAINFARVSCKQTAIMITGKGGVEVNYFVYMQLVDKSFRKQRVWFKISIVLCISCQITLVFVLLVQASTGLSGPEPPKLEWSG